MSDYYSSDLDAVMNSGNDYTIGDPPNIGTDVPLVSEAIPDADSGETPSGGGWFDSYNGGTINLSDSQYYTDGTSRNADYSAPETNGVKTIMDGLMKMFEPAATETGRNAQSLAAQMILGAAKGVMGSMAMDKQTKAASDLENQRSANRIKEADAALNLTRTASSAMPKMNTFNTRTVSKGGLLGGAAK